MKIDEQTLNNILEWLHNISDEDLIKELETCSDDIEYAMLASSFAYNYHFNKNFKIN